ncbi:TPA: hypothetical protein N0F65_002738 [Lagenidium giganteum]|uniref:PX domain-containing protein n=1 Tax=Lagenidium giganteum TaxID=4803 RepID=A0AAV2Z3Z2_9STRA|nr:TPA: hypothetical protein N0F65_002738 [Lagenidium giganteum]
MQSSIAIETRPLGPLSAVEVVPEHVTERTRVLSFLKRIDTIRIHEYEDHDGVVYYKMDVIFEHRITRIPTNRGKVVLRQYQGKADRVVLRRFSDFIALRKAMWLKVQEHGIMRCSYCEDIFSYILFSKSQPNVVCKLTTGKTKRMQILEAFINDIVVMARTCKSSRLCGMCAGVNAIPHLVSDFLQNATKSTM